jgi:hypothetical protein
MTGRRGQQRLLGRFSLIPAQAGIQHFSCAPEGLAPRFRGGREHLIRCPVLMTLAESDRLAQYTSAFFDALRCPKALIRFTDAEGAGGHCEMMNRSLVNRRTLDWLDQQFAA